MGESLPQLAAQLVRGGGQMREGVGCLRSLAAIKKSERFIHPRDIHERVQRSLRNLLHPAARRLDPVGQSALDLVRQSADFLDLRFQLAALLHQIPIEPSLGGLVENAHELLAADADIIR